MNSSATWQAIRELRASPTGAAASDRARKRTFMASLRQAEELADAAKVIGYAAKPLLLFYSLSQAGRAITAAHLSNPWTLHAHGLSVRENEQNPLLSVVEPGPKVKSQDRDSFGGVTDAINSPKLNGKVQLGAVWAANPDLREVSIPTHLGAWPRALDFSIAPQQMPIIFGEPSDPEKHIMTTGGIIKVNIDVPGETGREVAEALSMSVIHESYQPSR